MKRLKLPPANSFLLQVTIQWQYLYLILLLITELEAAYHTLADFADSEYERLKAHMKSPEFQNKLSLQKIQQEQAGELDKIRDKQTRELRYARYSGWFV